MSIEWVAQTDAFTCARCGSKINKGERVIGDVDQFFHKEQEDCE